MVRMLDIISGGCCFVGWLHCLHLGWLLVGANGERQQHGAHTGRQQQRVPWIPLRCCSRVNVRGKHARTFCTRASKHSLSLLKLPFSCNLPMQTCCACVALRTSGWTAPPPPTSATRPWTTSTPPVGAGALWVLGLVGAGGLLAPSALSSRCRSMLFCRVHRLLAAPNVCTLLLPTFTLTKSGLCKRWISSPAATPATVPSRRFPRLCLPAVHASRRPGYQPGHRRYRHHLRLG